MVKKVYISAPPTLTNIYMPASEISTEYRPQA